jgi:hypothetical protein
MRDFHSSHKGEWIRDTSPQVVLKDTKEMAIPFGFYHFSIWWPGDMYESLKH